MSRNASGKLQGKTAIVTGGASGIGLAVCRRFAQEGARVVVADISATAGEAAAAALRESGAEALFVEHDAGDEGAWRRLLERAVDASGQVHILVNNAYSGRLHTLGSASLEDVHEGFRVTAYGVFLGMKLTEPVMSDGGSIVNISSIAGYRASPSNAVYGAAKGAAGSLSRSAALAYARRGIRVNAVAPGITRTPSLMTTVESLFGASTPEQVEAGLERLRASVPLQRIADPEEVASAVLFLASDEASFITGVDLMVDGGAMLQ